MGPLIKPRRSCLPISILAAGVIVVSGSISPSSRIVPVAVRVSTAAAAAAAAAVAATSVRHVIESKGVGRGGTLFVSGAGRRLSEYRLQMSAARESCCRKESEACVLTRQEESVCMGVREV
jgi:hypothetical protein